ncbi:MAG TPA: type 4a pilus biogenesis protein PilO [Bacillota bacterium]|jgi:Tfp pilus assembly protein PilO
MSFLSRLSKRERAIIIGAGLIAFVLAVYFLAIDPQEKKLAAAKAAELKAAAQVREGRAVKAREDQIDQRMKAIQQEMKTLDLTVPGEREVAEFLFYIDASARTTKVAVNALKFATAAQVRDFAQYPIQFELTGKYPNIVNFLNRVESYPRLIRVEGFRAAPVGQEPGVVSSDFVAFIYSQPSRAVGTKPGSLVLKWPVGRTNPFTP